MFRQKFEQESVAGGLQQWVAHFEPVLATIASAALLGGCLALRSRLGWASVLSTEGLPRRSSARYTQLREGALHEISSEAVDEEQESLL